MDAIVAMVILVVGPFAAFAVAAWRFGVDSRLSINDDSRRWI